MLRIDLNGRWDMRCPDGHSISGHIPGSVYSFLLEAGEMGDPFFRDQELSALKRMEDDYIFEKSFLYPERFCHLAHQILRFDGIDTLADIYLNDQLLGNAFNMHREWEFDVSGIVREGENHLRICIHSPVRYIREQDKVYHLGGAVEAMRGFPHLRKAHCMFGWDWGPRLPDMGIWKDVSLLGFQKSRLTDVRITQAFFLPDGTPAPGRPEHADAARSGRLTAQLTVHTSQTGQLPVRVELETPEGIVHNIEESVPFTILHPALWWPNGLGEQPLYTVRVYLGSEVDTDYQEVVKKIGLRTMTIKRKKDQWGETFAPEVNGQTFFAMGADYIPEDNILSRCSRDKTKDLLISCRSCHFNMIRVWGGGIYPADYFYELCDELGLVVWQDLMFACANYRLTDEFAENITEEIRQNVRRLRHHASLGLWCGNNEMEQFAMEHVFDGDDITAADYLIQNEYLIPRILSEEDPDTFYWPSSPSSGGKFVFPQDPDRGDIHDWGVWHGGLPFTAYRSHYYRFLSEFGFQSFPCIWTVNSFTEAVDRNAFSYVMEMHQRNAGANGKILQYLSMTFRYPSGFDLLIYASQLLQAEAVRYGVEHFRRNRNEERCMGTVYWQLNDIWPGASWSSIDYDHSWKALQYYARRFFAPVLLSCEEDSLVSQGKTCISEPEKMSFSAALCVTNETWEEIQRTVKWELRDPGSRILAEDSEIVTVPPFTSLWLPKQCFDGMDPYTVHFSYRFIEDAAQGTVLFSAPKHYQFREPSLRLTSDKRNRTVTVTASAFAKSVEIYSEDGYIRLEDNYFDLEAGSRTIRVEEGEMEHLRARSVYDIK